MPHPASAKLRFGPYPTPRYKYRERVLDEARGQVGIVGTSDGRIAWPIGVRRGSRAVVLYSSLVSAVRRETAIAVRYWWGVSAFLIKKWRRALRVNPENEGRIARRREFGLCKAGMKRVKAMLRAAQLPATHAKIAATKRGKPRSLHVAQMLRKLQLGKRHSAATRRKMSRSHKLQWKRSPIAERRWQPWEDVIVPKLSPSAAAKMTRRTLRAVMSRRSVLKVPSSRPRGASARRELGRAGHARR